jgi:hypothetical protein
LSYFAKDTDQQVPLAIVTMQTLTVKLNLLLLLPINSSLLLFLLKKPFRCK